MTYLVEILEDVFYDVEDAIIYYNLQLTGLGSQFYKEFQEAIKGISAHPLIYQKKRKDYRQLKMRKFPFYIIYKVNKRVIIINRVFHAKRDPSSAFKG